MEITELKLSFYLDVLKRHWKAILGSVVLACALGLVYCQIAPKSYISVAVLLPEEGDKPLSSRMSMFAASVGISSQGKQKNSEIYKDVIKSRSFIQGLQLEKFKTSSGEAISLDTMFHLGKHPLPVRLDILSKFMSHGVKIEKAENGIIVMQLEGPDPVFCADLLNAILVHLDDFFRERDAKKTEKTMEFMKEKLEEKEIQFRRSGEKVATFISENQYLDPLKTPRLFNTLEGLKRDEHIQEEMYLLLYKENEQNRMEMQKEKSMMQILDYPEPALEKDKPKRRKIMVMVFSISLLASFLLFTLTDRLRYKA